jgi:hypothetical protein
MNLLLLFEEINHLAAFSKSPIVRQIMIQREFDNSSCQQQKAHLSGGYQVQPAFRRTTIVQIVVQPNPKAPLIRDRSAERVADRASVLSYGIRPIRHRRPFFLD